MNDGVDSAKGRGVRRRTVLTTALGAAPVAMAGGIVAGGPASAAPTAHRTAVEGLTVEHRTNPLGVDATHPRFGWRMASPVRGRRQSAYRILVATAPDRLTPARADVWDSGRVTSPASVALRYDGPAPQRRRLVELLAENIGNDEAYKEAHPDSTRVRYAENTLSVGFLGVNVLAPVLTDEGRVDLAYRLLHQDAMPSWLYSVGNGATTIWERWNSYSKEDGFGPVDMNSFNHYSYGAIMEWMYESMAGIAKDPAHPGFQHFFLRPHLDPTGRVTQVAGSHLSPYGEIVSEWRTQARKLTYRAVVPANSTATLRIPTADPDTVREGRTPLSRVPGVDDLGFEGGVASYRLPSGRYQVTAALG